jgi:N-acetylglucosaminyl-diphospho-decaprenol L-rhamnosyltransferase
VELAIGVVLYRNTVAQVDRLARSVALARGALRCEIFWLDNSPDDRLRATVGAAGGAYARPGENVGFGAGHNRLMAHAFGERAASAYVCVNPDAVLHPDCLAELVRAAAAPRAGLVEARQFPDEHPKPYDPATGDTPWCSGCVLLVTRALHAAVGGFDERFFLYCEDVDLSWRARAAGFTTRLAPRALAHHVATGRAGEQRMRLAMLRSALLLAWKYGEAAFAERCARELREAGARPPPASEMEQASPAERAAADFAHDLDFAEVRW